MDLGLKKGTGVLLVLGIFMMVSQGCAPAMAGALFGAGTYAFATGGVRETYQAPLYETYQANLAVLQEMGVTISEERYDSFKGVIRAGSPHAGRIFIELEPVSEDATEVTVQVGPFGNDHRSQMIHRAIAEELGFRRDLTAQPAERARRQESVTVLVEEQEPARPARNAGRVFLVQPPSARSLSGTVVVPEEQTAEEPDLYRPHAGATVVIIDGERVIVQEDGSSYQTLN